MVLPFLVPGRAVCHALGTRDGGHRGRPPGQGQATAPTKRPRISWLAIGWLRCRVGWWRLPLEFILIVAPFLLPVAAPIYLGFRLGRGAGVPATTG
jgi:hypothetical protein